MLSEAVQKALSERQWSYRQAAIATGVSYATVERMAKGIGVGAEPIARFAYKISDPDKRLETVVHWLKIAEKDDFASILTAIATAARKAPQETKQEVELPSGKKVLVLPSGREMQLTPENLTLIDSMLAVVEQVKQ